MLMVKRNEGQYLGILNIKPNSVNHFIKLAIVHMDRDVILSITKSNRNLRCRLVVIKLGLDKENNRFIGCIGDVEINGNIKMNGGCCNSDSNGIATVAVAAATTTTATTTTTTATTTTTTTTTTKTTVTATSPATIKATAVTTTIATTTTVSTAGTTTTLTFGIWQPYCNSTGDSPAPSTVGSCSDSSIGSVSPSLDFDENMCSVVATANGWSTFGGKFNNNVYCLNWPSTSAVATARATPLITQPLLDSTLFNDLLELTIDEKKKKAIITKTVSESAVTCASSGRLPVFAQLSNPSSAS